MSRYDVIVKRVDPEWVIACTEELLELSEMPPAHGRLWPRLHSILKSYDVAFTPPSIAVEQGQDPIRLTAAIPVPDDFTFRGGGVETIELPGIERAAATVIHGNPDFAEGFRSLKAWAREAGEVELGQYREVYLDCEGRRETWVVELQIGLQVKDQ